MLIEKIFLYRPVSPEDQICHLSLNEVAGGYVVDLQHGIRGAKLREVKVTPAPVDHDHARQLYAKLVAKKAAEGFVVESRTYLESVLQGPTIWRRLSRPLQIDYAQAGKFISSPDWWLQEKFGAKHLLLRKTEAVVDAIDEAGETVPLPPAVVEAAMRVPFRWLIEGACTGGTFVAFDIAQFELLNFRSLTYSTRMTALQRLLKRRDPQLTIAETATELTTKCEMLERLRTQRKKGIVLRKVSGVATRGSYTIEGYLLQSPFLWNDGEGSSVENPTDDASGGSASVRRTRR